MSNTPLTAKAKIACGFQAVPQSFLEHAENLERENDTLRKAHHKYKSTLHDLRSVLEVTPLESLVQAAQRLVAENAALRAERVLVSVHTGKFTTISGRAMICPDCGRALLHEDRAVIDAARKEAQP